MAMTRIVTGSIPREHQAGQGEVAEVLSKSVGGAQNVTCYLRWLRGGEAFAVPPLAETHQLVYLMEGEATIRLAAEAHEVVKGMGVYLGPAEVAEISHRGSAPVKLFHLVVPVRPDLQLDR